MKQRWRCLAASALLAGAGAGLGQATAPAGDAAAPVATQADGQGLADLVRDLGSDDSAVRQAAQGRLDRISWRQRDALQRLAGQTADPEANARLLARVDAIDEQLATDPPPISIDLHDAALPEVAAALRQALGVSVEASPARAAPNGPRYSLTATDQPFWEIFRHLTAQHRLGVARITGGVRLTETHEGIRDFQRIGGFAIYATRVERASSVDPQRDPKVGISPVDLSLRYEIAADPRIPVIMMRTPQFTSITGDRANAVVAREAGAFEGTERTLWSHALALPSGAVLGSRILAARGTAQFIVQVAEQVIPVDHAENRVGEVIPIANGQLTITEFAAAGQEITVNLAVLRTTPDPAAADLPLPATAVLVDSTGTEVWQRRFTRATSASVAGAFTPPLRLEVRVPARLKLITLPLEFKDIPLP